jgi:hypothetical protein
MKKPAKKPAKKWSLNRWFLFRSKLTKEKDNLVLLSKLALNYHRSGDHVPGWLWDSIDRSKREVERLSEQKEKREERRLKKINLTS